MDESWPTFLDEVFLEPRFEPADIHVDIYKLDAPFVITPNFDKIYDHLASKESGSTVKIKSYTDSDLADMIRGQYPVVLKMHGSIDNKNDMVFTRREYMEARRKCPGFYEIMDALMLTHTFLFIGCGLNDPDLQLFLERSVKYYQKAVPHYMTMPKPINGDIRDSVRKNFNVRLLPYSPKDGHEELKTSLKHLVDRVEGARDEISKTQRW
jgi:hypothetical protein